MSMRPLSKSEYILYLKHPAWLWLKRHNKEKLPQETEQERYQLDQGNEFESYAEQRFEDIVRLGFDDYEQYQSLPGRTEEVIQNGINVIAQGRIEANGMTCIVDVLERADGDTFNLYEIKATTSVKKEHEHDLAYQVHVLEAAGYKISRIFVVHANNEYILDGEIDPIALTTITNVTDKVRKREVAIEPSIERAKVIASSKTCPDISPTHAGPGAFTEWLSIYKALRSELPSDHIYNLVSIGVKRAKILEEIGAETFHDIPDSLKLTKKQQWQLDAYFKGRPVVHGADISSFVSSLTYPIYFLDYETFSHVIPPVDGVHSYQQVPFQYSLHRLDEDGTLDHFEYLHTEGTNPMVSLTQSLMENIGDTGSILVWYESFEKGRNDEMGVALPQAQLFYEELNERIVDLMIPFSKGLYVDALFGGSASIKKVLPVIVPELSYKDLAIQEGNGAQRMWMQTVFDGANEEQKLKIFDDLIKYCTLDTFAMVEILNFLKNCK